MSLPVFLHSTRHVFACKSSYSCRLSTWIAQAAAAPAQAAPAVGAMETLEDFRGHPQFNDLKRLVQRDPTQLSRVLQMIGQQSPNLLARIHENQGDFIALMNEPVDEAAPPAPAAPAGGMSALGSMMG